MPSTTVHQAGFSTERLQRISSAMQGYVDQKKLPGVVTLVARHGQVVYHEAFGWSDIEAGAPMQRDSIFRIYSMTKPITSVAVLMLLEEGHFVLDDPISNFIPEFGDSKVFAGESDERVDVTDLDRPITIRDLLTHRSGLTYGNPSGHPVERMHAEADILTPDEPLAKQIPRLARLPLAHQPGTTWHYGVSIDVLGRLVEVASGLSLDAFFQQRIFDPLGMVDSGFAAPENKLTRLTTVYSPGLDGGLHRKRTVGLNWDDGRQPALLSGGGGLLSTAGDYARFCQMLLNGGALDGVRLLSRKTIELMTADQMPGGPRPIPSHWNFPGHSSAFSMALGVYRMVDMAAAGAPVSVGSFGWAGAASTSFWIDPKEDLFAIIMLQVLPCIAWPAHHLPPLVYQALVD